LLEVHEQKEEENGLALGIKNWWRIFETVHDIDRIS